tara:strand:+ start:6670 stop:7344 length:675 start_codon:yes stop_codon:yes gene_type:complete
MSFQKFITESAWDDIKERWWQNILRDEIKPYFIKLQRVSGRSQEDLSTYIERQKAGHMYSYDTILKKFKKYKDNNKLTPEERDISNWMNKSFSDFMDMMREVKIRRSSKQERRDAKKGSDKIFENDAIQIIQINTWEASRYYGKGTKWCISAEDDRSHFDNIIENQLTILFLIDKLEKRKFAIVIDSSRTVRADGIESVWREDDTKVSVDSFKSIYTHYLEYLV